MTAPLQSQHSRVIYKFEMTAPCCAIAMPDGAKIISCGIQSTGLVVWALGDPAQAYDFRRVCAFNTGQKIESELDLVAFIGTVTSDTGIVWHVYEVSRS